LARLSQLSDSVVHGVDAVAVDAGECITAVLHNTSNCVDVDITAALQGTVDGGTSSVRMCSISIAVLVRLRFELVSAVGIQLNISGQSLPSAWMH
jgi:hypothetical protein